MTLVTWKEIRLEAAPIRVPTTTEEYIGLATTN